MAYSHLNNLNLRFPGSNTLLTKFVFFETKLELIGKQLSGKQLTIFNIERNCNRNHYLRISKAPLKSHCKRARAPAYSRAPKERVAVHDIDEDKCTSKLSNLYIFPRHDLVNFQIIEIIFLVLHTP